MVKMGKNGFSKRAQTQTLKRPSFFFKAFFYYSDPASPSAARSFCKRLLESSNSL